MAEVSLRQLSKVYAGGVEAVSDVSLDVTDGEMIVLVGPSGCGKSTTLRMIAGLEEVTSGDILIGNRSVVGVPPAKRDIAMVFQNYALYPHMTVGQNMEFGLRMRGVARAARQQRVADVAGQLGIAELLQRRPRELSGGQRQRVALGRAMVRDPQVFLLDEPLSNLDAKLRVQTRGEIAALHRRLGATMIYVTHDQVEAMTLGDRLVLMEGGRVRQVGTPREIYDRPANAFAATFIGSPAMNMLSGDVRGGQLTLSGNPIRRPVAKSIADGPLRVGIRPEHLLFGSRPGVVSLVELGGAEVVAAEYLGHETLFRTSLAGHELLVRTANPSVAIGDRVLLACDASHVHLFAATGDQPRVEEGP